MVQIAAKMPDADDVKNSSAAYQKQGLSGAIFLNSGRNHIERIEAQFRQEGRGFLLLTNGV